MCDDPNRSEEDVDLREKLLTRLVAVVLPAIDLLGKAIRGEETFGDDRQMRACVIAGAMAPLLLEPGVAPEPQPWLAHPNHSVEEVRRLLDIVEGKTTDPNRKL